MSDTPPASLIQALDAAVREREGREERDEVRFRCPSGQHADVHPSARWNRAKATWYCDACGTGGSARDLADRLGVKLPRRQRRGGAQKSVSGATVQLLANAKCLSVEELRKHGLFDLTYQGELAVAIPYRGLQPAAILATQYRIALTGKDRFRWKTGSHPPLYGLWRLDEARRAGWGLVVEGTSDCWTCWHYDIPCFGVPGKGIWKPEWAAQLASLDVVIWQEPDAADFTRRVGETLPGARVIVAPADAKDISEAHVRGDDVPALVARLRGEAVPVVDILDRERQSRLAELRGAAASVIAEPDPLPRIERSIRALGYGGDIKPPLIVYLAVTTRLLCQRAGTMPAHLLLLGPASAGKTYTMSVVLRLMPPDAKAEIDAGSPRVLIYDDQDLRHRALVFGEADSLPAGEDNPAASAVRTLLQDGRVSYKVVVKDPETGGYAVRTVDRPGPTVLITTAVKSLGTQLSSRLFSLDLPDDAQQFRAALAAQGALEEDGTVDADADLIAFQAYLQAGAPWDVTVPFAQRLASLLGQTHLASRVLRDFQRLLSLIKAVTVLRHERRDRNAQGRLIATIDDYSTVRDLVNHLYAATVAGGSLAIRETVAAVEELSATIEHPSALDVATHLGIHKSTATRRINKAISLGWLINDEEKRGKPYRLCLGDPMPDDVGLPAPETLRPSEAGGCTVATITGSNIHPPTDGTTASKLVKRGDDSSRQETDTELSPDPTVATWAREIATFTDAELSQYRIEMEATRDDDPPSPEELAALALAEAMRGGEAA